MNFVSSCHMANIFSWCNKIQINIAESTMEVEYNGYSNATSEVIWIRFLADLKVKEINDDSIKIMSYSNCYL